jgi:hypothetical protein
MSTIQEIERAVQLLEPADLAKFRAWFMQYDSDAWDRQMEADAAAGKFDTLIAEAEADLQAGRCTPL